MLASLIENLRAFVMAVVSPLIEKNPAKVASVPSKVVLSASRVIVLVIVAVWAVVTLRNGIDWPNALVAVAGLFAWRINEKILDLPAEKAVTFYRDLLDSLR